MKKPVIGIVGVGMVGGALHRHFPEAIPYDVVKHPHNKEKISSADIIFICVPTPYEEKGFDLSHVREAITNIKGEKTIVIKSTVIPGTTERLQEEYPHHRLLFNPEFLTESSADQDMMYPDRQIVGYTEKSYGVAGDIMRLLPLAPFERIMPATEAELVKYFNNAWFATKVIFANQIYDVANKMGLNYDQIAEAAAADKRVGPSHLQVMHKGYRGYGGKCLPKDIRALIQHAENLGLEPKLWKVVEEINGELTKNKVEK
jgi:UDPglucose 6-dehydrogenase